MAKLAVLTAAQEERVRNLLGRAKGRFDSAERASKRTSAQSGDYDNGFDGVVTGIYHILSAFELATTGRARSYGEADAPTAITHLRDEPATPPDKAVPYPSAILCRRHSMK